MPVGEPDQVGRLAVAAAYLDDLAVLFAGSDGTSMHKKPVTHGCLHHRHLREVVSI
jgi:hypothetical protein